MTGGAADLLDLHEEGVGVAVHEDLFDELDVPGGLPLHHDTPVGTAVKVGLAGFKGPLERLAVHVGEGEHFTGLVILTYDRDESAVIPLERFRVHVVLLRDVGQGDARRATDELDDRDHEADAGEPPDDDPEQCRDDIAEDHAHE